MAKQRGRKHGRKHLKGLGGIYSNISWGTLIVGGVAGYAVGLAVAAKMKKDTEKKLEEAAKTNGLGYYGPSRDMLMGYANSSDLLMGLGRAPSRPSRVKCGPIFCNNYPTASCCK